MLTCAIKNNLLKNIHGQLDKGHYLSLDVGLSCASSLIAGSEKVDSLAAGTKEIDISNISLPWQYYKSALKVSILNDWQLL